jgi:class 3 adenylate cyclase
VKPGKSTTLNLPLPRRLLELGITEGLDPVEARHTRLNTTLAALSAAWLVIAHLPGIPVIQDSWPLMLTGALAFLSQMVSLLLTSRGHRKAARTWMLAGTYIYTVGNSLLMGGETQNHVYLLVTHVGAFIIYPPAQRAWVWFWGILAWGSAIGLEIWFWTHEGVVALPFSLPVMRLVLYTALFAIFALLHAYTNVVLRNAEEALALEKKRADDLLRNTLPASVAERLLEDPDGEVADDFDDVAVIFADIVGFTPLSERVPPAEMIRILDDLFSEIDTLAAAHGMEKIRTIGDAWMGAAGCPESHADPVGAAAEVALGILAIVADFRKRTETDIDVRIGMNAGPVVGGIVGRHKYHYDVWGDTVNLAARMESHGEPGRIQLTEATASRLGEKHAVEERGVIEVKGKGKLKTFFLERAS